MRALVSLLLVGFLILAGAQPVVAEATIGLALHGVAVVLGLIPGIVLFAGGVLVVLRRTA